MIRLRPSRRRWARVGALAALLVVGLVARLWRLDSLPEVFFHDECDNTVNALQILSGQGPGLFGLDWKPQPAVAVHLIAASLAVLGPGIAAVRLPSALFGALTLPLLFVVARRSVGPWPAAAASLMLAFHPGFLHFSRSGWENVQICFWTLAALESVQRGAEGRSRWWWVAAGASSAIAGLTYFAGWLVIAVVLPWIGLEMLRSPERRRRLATGAAITAAAFSAVVAPFLSSLGDAERSPFARVRTVAVTATSAGAPDASAAATVAGNLRHSLEALWSPSANHQPPYFPPGRPLFALPTLLLAVLGMAAAAARPGRTTLWWLALLLPFVLTQGLARGAPNLARGVGVVPIVFLFSALGLQAALDLVRDRRRVTAGVLAALVATSVVSGAWTYLGWARSPGISIALQPAIPASRFRTWWEFQRRWIEDGRGFCNLRTWLALQEGSRAGEDAAAPQPAPHEAPPALAPEPAPADDGQRIGPSSGTGG